MNPEDREIPESRPDASFVFSLLRDSHIIFRYLGWRGDDYQLKHELRTMATRLERGDFQKAMEWLREHGPDTERMDWFSGGISRWLSECPTGEWCAQDDVVGHWYADTPRAAIDAAIADDKADGRSDLSASDRQ